MNVEIDGKNIEIEDGATLLDAVKKQFGKKDISVVAANIDGNDKPVDLGTPAYEGCKISTVKNDSAQGLEILRHSAAHIMAEAVKSLYPELYVTIGPAVKDGFYYDFDVETPFTPEDLPAIEKKMKEIVKEQQPFSCRTYKKEEALELFDKMSEMYKVEILQDIDADTVSVYGQGGFTDLCRGPHIPHTGYLKAFKLLSVAGAYWRGDSNNKMLSRIYGTAFADRGALDAYLKRMKEAKERDHRKLGKELDLFSFHDEGPGFPFWHANGMILYRELERYILEQNTTRGYGELKTPVILNEEAWHKSGHWDNYRENMYFTEIDEIGFAVRPMNCPGGLMIYNNGVHSYRDLPLRLAELGLVHRHELSGVLHGLFRVRSFTQDDAHIFCTPEQAEDEIVGTVDYIRDVYAQFGFEDLTVYIATKPDKAIGDDSVWETATELLKRALQRCDIDYELKEGEGAFYGPKIEFNIKDVLERNWQCGTVQVDFSMPKLFDLTYEGSDGEKHAPVMLHRAVFGSLERFIGILIEHYNGKFPLWLSPKSAVVMTIANNDAQENFAKEVFEMLRAAGLRPELDIRNEKLGYKIRQHRLQRIPYMVIIGDEEASSKTLSLRVRDGDEVKGLLPQKLCDNLKKEKEERMNQSVYGDDK